MIKDGETMDTKATTIAILTKDPINNKQTINKSASLLLK